MAIDWNPPEDLVSGFYDLSCSVVDWGINAGLAEFDDYQDLIQLDAKPPSAPAVTSSETPTTNVRPTWTWSSGGGDGVGIYRIALNDEDILTAAETTDLRFYPRFRFAAGDYTLYVQERDAYGNWSPSGSFAVEVTDS